jgi:Fe(3+) dicitrate transport protein
MSKALHFLFFSIFINSIQTFSQDTSRIKTTQDVILLEGLNQKGDLFRMPTISGTDIFSGKKNEVISLGASTADLSTNNTRQIFAKVPGLSIWENDGSGIQTGIATRGLSPNRSWEFNVRQNGADISSEVFGYPEAYFTPPTEAMERIEVVRGAGALQYGPQFGGLLNYVSKKQLGDKPLSMESSQTIGAYGLFNSYNAIGGQLKKFKYYAYLHHRNADGWRENSRYNTQTAALNFTYVFNSKWQLNGEYTHMNYLSQQAGGLTDTQFATDPQQSLRARNWFSTPWNTTALTLQYKASEQTLFTLRAFGILAQRNSIGFTSAITIADTINENIGSYNPRQIDRDGFQNFGAELRGLHQYQFLKGKSALSGGLRIYKGQTLRHQKGIGSTGADFSLDIISQQNGLDYAKSFELGTLNAAAFVENMFQITKKFAITPGLRYEWIESTIDGYINTSATGKINDARSRQLLLLGIGAEYTLTAQSNLYGNFSQGYRPVTFSELTPSATADVIDPQLKDASGYNADFGFRGSIKQQLLKFDVGVFRLFYNNRIGTITLNNAPYKTNIGASVSQGIESFMEFDVMRLFSRFYKLDMTIFTNYAYVDARYTRWDNPDTSNDPSKNLEGKRVENAPQHILRAGLSAKFKGFAASLQYNYVAAVFTDALNTIEPNATFTTGQLPAYQLLDFNMTYAFKEVYQFRAGINNLTNEMYSTRRASGYPGPGILPGTPRTFYLSIGVKL